MQHVIFIVQDTTKFLILIDKMCSLSVRTENYRYVDDKFKLGYFQT